MPGLPVHCQLLESIQTHVHWVGDAIQPSYPLMSPSPPALNLSKHQGLFKWVAIRWPKYRMDWLDLLAVQGTLKSLLQHHSSKASILRPLLSLILYYYRLESLRIFGHRTLHFYRALDPKHSWTCHLPRNKVCLISGLKKHKLPKCLITGCASGGSHSVEFTSTIVLAKPHESYQCSGYALGTKSRFQDLSLTKDGTSLV